MCGIGFWFNRNGIDQKAFGSAMHKILHRGPDHQEVYKLSSNTIMGSNRLAIIDIHERSNQPFIYKRWSITFNGAIYNFNKIKNDLLKVGHIFKTESDTELILHAYAEYGSNCVHKFKGMWAFIIYDSKKNEVFCSRDRFGIKPLLYSINKNKLIVFSEFKPFTKINSHLTLNINSVKYFLESGGFKNHSDQTFFEEILQLNPACNLTYKIDSGEYKINKYYDLKNTSKKKSSNLKDKIKAAIRDRMIADMPPSVMFSGGLDSSILLVELMKLNTSTRSFSFIEDSNSLLDESPYINAFLQKYPHANKKINLEGKLKELINECCYNQELPPASLSCIAQYSLYNAAKKQGEKLMLSGQGADEIFAGYPRNFSLLSKSMFIKNPIASISFLANNWDAVKGKLTQKSSDLFQSPICEKNKISTIQEYMLYLMNKNGLRDLLYYEDKNSMSNSIETRLPFLDHDIVEYAYHLADEEKMKNLRTKAPLVNLYKEELPPLILGRKRKMAFDTPEVKLLANKFFDIEKELNKLIKRLPQLDFRQDLDIKKHLTIFQQWQVFFLNIFLDQWSSSID